MTFTELMLQKFPNADLRNLFIDCCPLMVTDVLRIVKSVGIVK